METLKLKENFIRLASEQRLYNLDKAIVALTGGIATGKSSVSNYLISKAYPVIDADQLVKEIYSTTESKKFIESLVPSAIKNQEISFKNLREAFFSNSKLKKKIELYIFSKLENKFKEKVAEFESFNFIIYDAPVLFEKKIDHLCDVVITVYATDELQKRRLIARDSINEELAASIISQQLSIEEKKHKADLVINNTQDLGFLYKEIDSLLEKIIKTTN